LDFRIYVDVSCVIGGLVGIGFHKNTSNKTVPEEDEKITGFTKCYTINTMLMKFMIPFS
jgi:hypothetical protein